MDRFLLNKPRKHKLKIGYQKKPGNAPGKPAKLPLQMRPEKLKIRTRTKSKSTNSEWKETTRSRQLGKLSTPTGQKIYRVKSQSPKHQVTQQTQWFSSKQQNKAQSQERLASTRNYGHT